MTTTGHRFGDEEYPRVGRDADRDSVEAQKRATHRLFIELVCLLLVAVAGDVLRDRFDKQSAFSWVPGFVSLVVVAAAVLARVMRKRKTRVWFHGRAVAESVRTTTWLYMMGVPPVDDSDEVRTRLGEVLAVVRSGSRWRDALDSDDAITNGMRFVRSLPVAERTQLYASDRLDDQITWYERKARRNKRRGNLFLVVFVLAQTGTLVAAISLALGGTNIVGILATLAASVEAWSQYRRYDELEDSYDLAHDELVTIRGRTSTIATDADLAKFVRDGESVISREHTVWVARSDARLADTIREAASDDTTGT